MCKEVYDKFVGKIWGGKVFVYDSLLVHKPHFLSVSLWAQEWDGAHALYRKRKKQCVWQKDTCKHVCTGTHFALGKFSS